MWSLDFRVGVIIAGLAVVIGLVLIIAGRIGYARERAHPSSYFGPDYTVARLGFFGGLAVVMVTLAISAAALYPYGAEYHQIRPVAGPVQAISSRFLSADGQGTSQKFVVQINGREYGCNDTRCALVKVGDYLVLGCQRVWQFGSTDGYDCVYRANKGKPVGRVIAPAALAGTEATG